MVDIEILIGVGGIERRAVVGVPEGAFENQEVVAAIDLCDGTDDG